MEGIVGDDRDRVLAADGDGVVVRTVWAVTEPAIHAFRSSPLVEGFIAGDLEAASPDIYMRWAELKDVLESLHSNLGRTFVEESEAENSLFGCGGGFGIPNVLKDEVFAILKTRAGDGRAELPAKMPPGVAEMLGTYVYALLDPRDRTIFYVGKGRGDRVYSHVWAAMGAAELITDGVERESAAVRSAKADRVRDIYRSGAEVEHVILRHQIGPAETADTAAYAIEQTLIDVLRLLDFPGGLTNIAGGHTETALGVLPLRELIQRYAAVPAPLIERPFVVLVVNAALDPLLSREEVYEKGRGWWKAGVPARSIAGLPVFFVAADIVRAVYRADKWEQKSDGSWRFEGETDADLEAKYVGTSLAELKKARSDGKWRQHGWHPYL